MPKAKPTGMPSRGRPTLLSAKATKAICKALEDGNTLDIAASAGGISYDSFNNWRKRGKAELERREAGGDPNDETGKSEQSFFDFFNTTTQSEIKAEMDRVARLNEKAKAGDTRIDEWILERRYPARWAKRTYARIEGMDALIEEAEKRGISVQELIAAMHEALLDDNSDD